MSFDPIRMSVLVEQNKALDEYNKVLEERNRLLVALLDSHARDVAAHREVFDPSDNAGEDGFESHLRALSLSSQLGASKDAVLELGRSIDLVVMSFAPFEVEKILIPSEVSSMLRVDAVLVDGRPQRHGSTKEGSFDPVSADIYREDSAWANRHYKACRSFVVRVTNVGGAAIPLSSQGIQRAAVFGRYVLCTAAERDLEEKLHRAETERDLAVKELETLTSAGCAKQEAAATQKVATAHPFPAVVKLLEWGKTRNAVRREAIKAIRAYGAWEPSGKELVSGDGLADMVAGLPFFGPFCICLPPGSTLEDAFSARGQIVAMIRTYRESATIDTWVERVLCHRFATDAAVVSGVVMELVGVLYPRIEEG